MTRRFAFVAACAAGLALLLTWPPGPGSETDGDLGLHRSSDVIDAKIARKEAKMRGEYTGSKAGPEGRAEWRRMMRDGMEPARVRESQKRALRHLANMPAGGFTEDAAIDDWYWFGPGNIGGRIRSLDIDPTNANIMHAAAVGGGVWRTTNGGSSWYPVNDFLPNLAVVSLARAPNATLYAGTGEGFGNVDALPGDGIYRSTNGGVSWARLASTDNANFQFVNRIGIDPTDSNTVLAATTSGLWRSTDAGGSWTREVTGSFDDIKFHPNEDDAIAAQGDGDVFVSFNGGADWTNQSTGGTGNLPTNFGRCEVFVTEEFTSETDTWYVSCERAGASEIWRATGETLSWTRRFAGAAGTAGDYLGRQAWYDNAIWVSRADVDDIIVGGIDLFRSTNGGSSITQISNWRDYHDSNPGFSPHADQHFILEHPGFNGGTNRTVFVTNDGGVQRTSDILTVSQNSGWLNLANNLGITQFYDGDASPDMSVALGGAQDNSVLRYRSVDGSQNWFQQFTGDGMGVAVDFTNSNTLYSTTQNLCPLKSTNGGASWFNIQNGITNPCSNSHPFVPPFEMDPNNASRIYAGSANLWRTTNGGSSWSSRRAATSGTITAIDIAEGNSNVVWIGYTTGEVARSTNGTSSWTRVDNNTSAGSPTPPNVVVTDIKVDPTNDNRVFVSFGGYATDRLWMTDDNGATWQNISGTGATALPAIQINTIETHPVRSNWLYVGTDLGVLASENRGATWSVTPRYASTPNGNEGPVNTEVADLFWAGDRLIAATHGRGMYWTRPLAYVYVDDSNSSFGTGTFSDPYRSFATAYANAGNGSVIYVFSGNYDLSSITLSKRVTVYKYGTTGSAVVF
ncbi:MAG: hypothetical protein AAF752_05295 [Bacteroidota bacterium]